MKKPTVEYSKGEIGRLRIVEDFLPSPDKLVLIDAPMTKAPRRRGGPKRKLMSIAVRGPKGPGVK
jgi:hypothetical protein